LVEVVNGALIEAVELGAFALFGVLVSPRELIEQGFEVAVAKDATAAPKHPKWGYGYTAALINFAFLAHAVWTTDEAVKAMERGSECSDKPRVIIKEMGQCLTQKNTKF
jgi:hypothetical protein